MKELFDDAGHLTEYALKAVIHQNLDEFSRLEISEHLSFCDACLVSYTALLSDDMLEEPPEPLAPGIMQKIRRAAIVFFFNKYITMAFAASAAIVLWITGAFTSFDNTNIDKFATRIEYTSDTIARGTVFLSDGISNALSGLFNTASKKGTTIYEEK